MYEYLIITGVNSSVNPGNNAFYMTPALINSLVSVRPITIIGIWCYVDRFVFRTNGETPAKIDLYAFLN
jgi:hypothetical protein